MEQHEELQPWLQSSVRRPVRLSRHLRELLLAHAVRDPDEASEALTEALGAYLDRLVPDDDPGYQAALADPDTLRHRAGRPKRRTRSPHE